MIRIAVVDDDEQYLDLLSGYIRRFESENAEPFTVTTFKSGFDFIETYKLVYDIVFLDIEMPLMDGLSVAKRLRRVDSEVCIVFVTNMGQFAIRGYEVNAVDFVVKPISYFNFADKLKKALGFCAMHRQWELAVKTEDGVIRVNANRVTFIVKDKNYLVYHMDTGEMRQRGTLESVEQELVGGGFYRCNSGCLVNLRAVSRLEKDVVIVGEHSLPLSRRLSKDFRLHMLEYFRGGV